MMSVPCGLYRSHPISYRKVNYLLWRCGPLGTALTRVSGRCALRTRWCSRGRRYPSCVEHTLISSLQRPGMLSKPLICRRKGRQGQLHRPDFRSVSRLSYPCPESLLTIGDDVVVSLLPGISLCEAESDEVLPASRVGGHGRVKDGSEGGQGYDMEAEDATLGAMLTRSSPDLTKVRSRCGQ